MDSWQSVVQFLHVIFAIIVVVLVLIQTPKTGGLGGAFGGGSSNNYFGAAGSANFVMKLTAAFALLFVMSSLYLDRLNTQNTESSASGSSVLSQGIQLPSPVTPVKK